ncbi:ALI_collapsed_G0025240.mRNA.1.CDS.1 [Saccharomyces cerevisiae]|nr:ALI_collapsed_G0025240.mRNA.1.CDS.1 [Saccharomyces cerevisiae]
MSSKGASTATGSSGGFGPRRVPIGYFSLTVTTRTLLHGFMMPAEKKEIATWHEFSRPQTHGYDMICVGDKGHIDESGREKFEII